ncbi:MAG: hypothetical protein O2780_01555 [Proteobacteria bacterium]|jgi:hypothetical protein|nr:hypothetical protein [Pseudomonadota bacterium]MDA1299532.1 hypothetical protein [Pseudomonadota bacterium]
MDTETFLATAPDGESQALQALWWEKKGDWDRAHKLLQASTPDNDWVHAYLHRVEGDLSNAGYWYRRAKRPVPEQSLAAEWQAIISELLAAGD